MLPRNIGEVMDRIVAELPEGHPAIARINELTRMLPYSPPEQNWYNWQDLVFILEEELPNPPNSAWSEKIGRIIRAEE